LRDGHCARLIDGSSGGPGARRWLRDVVVALLKDIEDTIQQDPIGSLRYSTYRIVSSSAEPSTA
jgi:hypothetical protein